MSNLALQNFLMNGANVREEEFTWQKLINALRSTSKRVLASDIEDMLSLPQLQPQLQWKDETVEEKKKGIVGYIYNLYSNLQRGSYNHTDYMGSLVLSLQGAYRLD